jgi:hypothetical protein
MLTPITLALMLVAALTTSALLWAVAEWTG